MRRKYALGIVGTLLLCLSLSFVGFAQEAWADESMEDSFNLSPEEIAFLVEMMLPTIKPLFDVSDQYLRPELDYKVEVLTDALLGDADALQLLLNELGDDSWQLVTIKDNLMIFERRTYDTESLTRMLIEFSIQLMEDPFISGAF